MFQFELDNALLNVNKKLNSQIVELILQKKLSISVAESVTAGMIFNSLASIEQVKVYCIGGVVCQHVRSYIALCGVRPVTYKEAGLKGAALSIEMAQGVKGKSQSDIALGVYVSMNKISQDDLLGNVYISVVGKKQLSHHVVLEGSESKIKSQVLLETLIFFRDSLKSF